MSEKGAKKQLRPVIIGMGGHGAVVQEMLKSLGTPPYGYCDHVLKPEYDNRLKYLGPETGKKASDALDRHPFLVTIGNNALRTKVSDQLIAAGFHPFGPIIHPSASVSTLAGIGFGTQVLAGAIVNTSAWVGVGVILNSGSIVEHDTSVGDYSHVAPGAVLAADISVGKGVLIGAGAVVVPGVNIGDWAVIGAGAVVIKDVPAGATVVGNPARIVKRKDL